MSKSVRSLAFYATAIGLHAVVLFGLHLGAPAFISDAESGPDATEVTLVESAAEETAAEPPALEPQAPAPPEPEPTPPEPQVAEPPTPTPPPEHTPAPPPPDAIPEPKPEPAKSEPQRPPPKPVPKAVTAKPAPVAKPSANVAAKKLGSPSGNLGSPPGKPGRGDTGHATWRNKVHPAYPASARAARLTGRVQIQIHVNALGQPTSARIVQSSGVPSLDEAALRAARVSTFNPKRLAGIPLPDTIIVPITFRLDGR